MVYMKHASHLQAREQNRGHFVYSKVIVKKPYSRWLEFLKFNSIFNSITKMDTSPILEVIPILIH